MKVGTWNWNKVANLKGAAYLIIRSQNDDLFNPLIKPEAILKLYFSARWGVLTDVTKSRMLYQEHGK